MQVEMNEMAAFSYKMVVWIGKVVNKAVEL